MRLALTVAPDRVDALWTSRDGASTQRSYATEGASLGDALTSALDAIAAEIPHSRRVRLRVALMPPLVAVRRVELPPMRDAERRLVIARQAERWFLSPGAPLAIAHRVMRRARKGPSQVLLAAANESLLTTIYDAAAARGWTVGAVMPAHAAWLAYALEHWPALREGRATLVARTSGESQLLEVVDGTLQIVRRCRAVDAAGLPPAGAKVRLLEDPTSAALSGASSERRGLLQLTTDARRAQDGRRVRKHSAWLYAAAAAVCFGAAGLQLVGIHRELGAVRAARDAHRSRVQQTLTLRDSLAGVTAELDELGHIEAEMPLWSSVIAHVAAKLPEDAHLIGLHAVGDSLILDGQAQNAAGVFAAMHNGAGLAAVSAAAPIRQEVVPGQPTVEHWTMAAHVEEK